MNTICTQALKFHSYAVLASADGTYPWQAAVVLFWEQLCIQFKTKGSGLK